MPKSIGDLRERQQVSKISLRVINQILGYGVSFIGIKQQLSTRMKLTLGPTFLRIHCTKRQRSGSWDYGLLHDQEIVECVRGSAMFGQNVGSRFILEYVYTWLGLLLQARPRSLCNGLFLIYLRWADLASGLNQGFDAVN